MTLLEGHMPRTLRIYLQAGIIIIHCEDEGTGKWLNGYFQEVIAGTALKVMSASDLPKPVKVAFKMMDTHIKDPAFLLKQLNRLNSELKCEEWKFIHKLAEPHSIR